MSISFLQTCQQLIVSSLPWLLLLLLSCLSSFLFFAITLQKSRRERPKKKKKYENPEGSWNVYQSMEEFPCFLANSEKAWGHRTSSFLAMAIHHTKQLITLSQNCVRLWESMDWQPPSAFPWFCDEGFPLCEYVCLVVSLLVWGTCILNYFFPLEWSYICSCEIQFISQ
jgi:hypothetical protein